MNQHDAQLKYKEFQDKLRAPYCVGVAQHLEHLALKNELEQFRQNCSANGINLLEPCPFCGSYDVEFIISMTSAYKLCRCLGCEAEGPAKDTKELAIAAWNKRVN